MDAGMIDRSNLIILIHFLPTKIFNVFTYFWTKLNIMKVDYIALSIPIFFILIAIELAYTYSKKLRYFRLNDSLANLSQGIGQQIIGVFMKTALDRKSVV